LKCQNSLYTLWLFDWIYQADLLQLHSDKFGFEVCQTRCKASDQLNKEKNGNSDPIYKLFDIQIRFSHLEGLQEDFLDWLCIRFWLRAKIISWISVRNKKIIDILSLINIFLFCDNCDNWFLHFFILNYFYISHVPSAFCKSPCSTHVTQ
jgi:hypothetical protein